MPPSSTVVPRSSNVVAPSSIVVAPSSIVVAREIGVPKRDVLGDVLGVLAGYVSAPTAQSIGEALRSAQHDRDGRSLEDHDPDGETRTKRPRR